MEDKSNPYEMPPDESTLHKAARQEAARLLGQSKSERKRAAVRENGKKGGRPRGSRNSAEVKARMSEAQRRRRAGEQLNPDNNRMSKPEK